MIHYRKGYKYQLAKTAIFKVPVYVDAESEFIMINSGMLTVQSGYAWDGPSGPAFDTESFMQASLIHDAIYQLMREGVIGQKWRKTADKEMRKACLKDGMSSIRAWWCYRGVHSFASRAASPESRKKVLSAGKAW